MEKIKIYFDGSCQVNPFGQIGYGCWILYSDGTKIEFYDGDPASEGNSNNVAEYRGLMLGLKHIQDCTDLDIEVFGDSKLVVNQMQGFWKIKDGYYKKDAYRARDLAVKITKNKNKIRFKWIPREHNSYADELSNKYHELNSLDTQYAELMRKHMNEV